MFKLSVRIAVATVAAMFATSAFAYNMTGAIVSNRSQAPGHFEFYRGDEQERPDTFDLLCLINADGGNLCIMKDPGIPNLSQPTESVYLKFPAAIDPKLGISPAVGLTVTSKDGTETEYELSGSSPSISNGSHTMTIGGNGTCKIITDAIDRGDTLTFDTMPTGSNWMYLVIRPPVAKPRLVKRYFESHGAGLPPFKFTE